MHAWSCTGLEAVSGFAVDEGGNDSEEEGSEGHHGARPSQLAMHRAIGCSLADRYTIIEINMMVIETVIEMAIFIVMGIITLGSQFNSPYYISTICPCSKPRMRRNIIGSHRHCNRSNMKKKHL